MEKIQKNIVLIKLDIDMKKCNFKECGLCRTAAVISPVATINDIKFETSEETVIRKLLIL